MNQLQLFIAKAKENEKLYKKLEDLSINDASDEELIKLAADYGFIITKEELEQSRASAYTSASTKINESELDNVVGGNGRPATENRFDSNVCPAIKSASYRCVGLMKIVWCDHYERRFMTGSNYSYSHQCKMGCYKYVSGING